MILYIIFAVVGLFFSFILVGFVAAADNPSLTNKFVFSLIALYFIVVAFVYWQSTKGRGTQSAIFLLLPPFLTLGIIEVGEYGLLYFGKNSPKFISECRDTGSKYYKLPTKPVHSVAYQWNGKGGTGINIFKVGNDGLINVMGGSYNPFLTDDVQFIEEKTLNGQYVRYSHKNKRDAEKINNFSADIIVDYNITPLEELEKAQKYQG